MSRGVGASHGDRTVLATIVCIPVLPPRLRRALARVVPAATVVAATSGLVALVPSGPAAAYPYPDVSFIGHGWGHGRGMGQWGALGYAVGQVPYQQILSTYYGALSGGGTTSLGSLPNGWSDASTPVKVAITANAGNTVIVTSGSPFTVTGVAAPFGPGGSYPAVMLQLAGGNGTTGQWNVFGGGGCAGPSWTPVALNVADPTISPVTPAPFPADAGVNSEVLQLCQPGGNLMARGSIQGVINSNNQTRTVNIVPLGQYVADVTPSESPTGWGSLGGAGPQGQSWGFQALEAQAVAARSYVMSTYGSLQGWFGYADICDSSACQDYPGIANENTVTDAATADTPDLVVLMPTGTVATTQYSSSTGGYSAGGTFAPVPDAGDAVCLPGACNAHHTWHAAVPVSAIEAAYPQIGTLISVGVSQRNGFGDLGGRVVQMTLQGTSQSVSISGDTFASQFSQDGVQSNWFAVTSQPSGGVGGYWMLGNDGGVFSFGDARFFGSMGGVRLNAPMVGMAGTPDGGGYWTVAADGGVFSLGDAPYEGSLPGVGLRAQAVSVLPTRAGLGYLIVTADGQVVDFGDAPQFSDVAASVAGWQGRLVGGATSPG